MKNASKIQEYAIKYLHEVIKMEPKIIAKEIGTTTKNVQKILDIKQSSNAIKTVSSSVENSQELIKNTTISNRGGVSIMTEAASMKSDELKHKLGQVVSRTARNAIFRPRD